MDFIYDAKNLCITDYGRKITLTCTSTLDSFECSKVFELNINDSSIVFASERNLRGSEVVWTIFSIAGLNTSHPLEMLEKIIQEAMESFEILISKLSIQKVTVQLSPKMLVSN